MLWMLAVCSIGMTALSLLFGRVIAVQPGTIAQRPHIQWLGSARATPSPPPSWRSALADLLDPSLMSLPSGHGFSRHLWQRDVAASRRALDWPSDPSYLAAPSAPSFRSILETPPLPELVWAAAEKLPAEPAEESPESIEPPFTLNNSAWRIEGALQAWSVLEAPALEIITSDKPLRPTRVRIGATSDGVVRYALIHQTSGNETADAAALEWARQIRFEPQAETGNGAVTWGVASFFWLTKPPPAANGTKN